MIRINEHQAAKFISRYKTEVIASITALIPDDIKEVTDSNADLVGRILKNALSGAFARHAYRTPERYIKDPTNNQITESDFTAYAIEILRSAGRVDICRTIFEPHVAIDSDGSFIPIPMVVPQPTVSWNVTNGTLRCLVQFPNGNATTAQVWRILV